VATPVPDVVINDGGDFGASSRARSVSALTRARTPHIARTFRIW
jgi:hypothetical protein